MNTTIYIKINRETYSKYLNKLNNDICSHLNISYKNHWRLRLDMKDIQFWKVEGNHVSIVTKSNTMFVVGADVKSKIVTINTIEEQIIDLQNRLNILNDMISK